METSFRNGPFSNTYKYVVRKDNLLKFNRLHCISNKFFYPSW